MPLTLRIFFLLVNFHIYQELIFEKNLQKYLILMSLRALEVIEIFKFLQAISPAGRIFVSWAHEERANERSIFDTFLAVT